jgi:hypothetical protein
MKILKEGDTGRAFHPDRGELVEVVYLRRRFFYQAGGYDVTTLVGVHLASDTVLIIPQQSVPDVASARRAKEDAPPAPPPSPPSSAVTSL